MPALLLTIEFDLQKQRRGKAVCPWRISQMRRDRIIVLAFVVLTALVAGRSPETVAYPEGYRAWTHVKSAVIGPAHPNFATNGGFQHVYANERAMDGYRTRIFPEGSVIVVDWLGLSEGAAAFAEGPRRQIDVMVRDSLRFSASGGWGFQRFTKDSKTEYAATPTPEQCFNCHNRLKKDALVLGNYRP